MNEWRTRPLIGPPPRQTRRKNLSWEEQRELGIAGLCIADSSYPARYSGCCPDCGSNLVWPPNVCRNFRHTLFNRWGHKTGLSREHVKFG